MDEREFFGALQKPFVVLPFIPPSSNKIYNTNRQGVRFLSAEAKKFKAQTISHIQQQCLPAIALLNPQALYSVWYAFFFPTESLINSTFGNGKKGSAQTRYKRMDVENRLKLTSDALASAIGIDDSLFFEGGHTKLSCDLVKGIPQTQIYLTQQDPKRFGLGIP